MNFGRRTVKRETERVESSPDPITIEYQPTADGLLAMQEDLRRSSRVLGPRKSRIIVSSLFFVGFTLVMLLQLRGRQPLNVWVWMGVFFFIWGALLLRLRKKRQSVFHKLIAEGQNRHLYGTRRLTISREGVREESEFTSSNVAWEAIERVHVTPTYVFIYVGNLGGYSIPMSAFESDDLRRRFVTALSAFHTAFARGLCKKCGYDLVGNVSGRCPECGQLISESA